MESAQKAKTAYFPVDERLTVRVYLSLIFSNQGQGDGKEFEQSLVNKPVENPVNIALRRL
jgi:hypothetical protein